MKLPVLSLVGPTATGKTSLALAVSTKVIENTYISGVDLISADSRQVYQGLETVTGADIPADFVTAKNENVVYPYFQKNNLALHGVSIIAPDEEWSVAHFRNMAQEIITRSFDRHRLPVVVGGTGLYHRYLFSTDPQVEVPPNAKVREKSATMSLKELQQWAAEMQPQRFASLNNSDKHNPRRLVRIIEIGQAKKDGTLDTVQAERDIDVSETQHLFVGLKLDTDTLAERISSRVKARMKAGAQSEVEQVYNRYKDEHVNLQKKKIPAFSSLGFNELLAYIQGEITREECLSFWIKKELSYAKRQMTWFKKNKEIQWFSADAPSLKEEVYLLLEKSL